MPDRSAVDPEVDAYIERSTMWPAELRRTREVLLGCGLDEQVKWNKPCYGRGGANIAILQEMKGFLALMFFKGALLDDPAAVLRSQGPNSRSAKRVELTSVAQVEELAPVIEDLVAAAVAAEAAGFSVPAPPPVEMAAELAERLAQDPDLAAAFDALTPGRQREYNLHIGQAKQASTREARVDKHVERIRAGKGLRDR